MYYFVFVIVALVFVLVRRRITRETYIEQPPKQYRPTYDGPIRNDNSIFVSIASYRDPTCIATVRDAFQKAAYPQRITVGIVQQNKEDTEQCVPEEFANQIRVLTLGHDEARGPTYARYLLSTLYEGQTFYFQIDAHTRFESGWDRDLVSMWNAANDLKAVLSHYPHTFENQGSDTVPRNCAPVFQSEANAILVMGAQSLPPTETPKLSYFLGSNMLFMPGQAVLDVPYNHDLDHLFHGEEMLHAVRLYTHGYNVYAPTKNTVYHYYGREDMPKYWEDLSENHYQNRVKGEETALSIMQLIDSPYQGEFGLGSQRTAESFWKHTGIDFKHRQINTVC